MKTSSKKQFLAQSEADLPSIAKEVIDIIGEAAVVLFYGEMGAGKTTFIRSLCKELGVDEPISSPTFSLVNEYQTREGKTIYHFDLYRVETPEEALDMGVDEYFYSKNYCFVEWPEKINDYLPEDAMIIKILEELEGRKIVLEKNCN